MATQTRYPHVLLDETGRAVIQGTTMKVIELVAEKLAYGWSPEELHLQHPYMSMGQIHGALSYYWDHAETLDREIGDQLNRIRALRKETEGPLSSRLKTHGRG